MHYIKHITLSVTLALLLLQLPLMMPSAEAQLRNIPTTTTITCDTTDLGFLSLNEPKTITLTITYSYSSFFFPLPKKRTPTNITLSIQKPSWCDAILNTTSIELTPDTIFSGQKNATATLTVSLTDPTAPAFSHGSITINATAAANGKLLPSYNTKVIALQPDFIGNIDSSISTTSVNLTSGKHTNFTITITNNGNAKISANIDTEQTPTNYFTIQLLPTSILCDVKEEQTFNVTITATPPTNITQATENITFTIVYHDYNMTTSDRKITLPTLTATLKPEKEKSSLSFDFSDLTTKDYIIIILIIIIILLLIEILVILKKRRKA
jgi:hypothetical protein